jgi:hypothetical protein
MNVTVYTEGTGVISDDKIAALVNEHFDLRPKGIIQMLDLLRPIYEKTAAYGHFGREEPEFTWERTDKAAALRAAAGPVRPAAQRGLSVLGRAHIAQRCEPRTCSSPACTTANRAACWRAKTARRSATAMPATR